MHILFHTKQKKWSFEKKKKKCEKSDEQSLFSIHRKVTQTDTCSSTKSQSQRKQ